MSKSKVFFGTVAAAAAGFVAGILSAPKSGKETRADLMKSAEKAKDVTARKADDLKAKAQEVAGDVAEKAESIAKDATAKVKEVAHDAAEKGEELKGRVEQAVEGAQKGFNKKPTTKK